MSLLSFLKVALKDFRVGAVMPSSPHAVRSILRRLPEKIEMVLEYGPGDGVITRELLKHLSPEGKFLVIETSEKFVETLGRIADDRLSVIQGDATKAAAYARERGLSSFDLVISGIPFSLLPSSARRATVDMTFDLLKPGGVFLVYQTSPLMVPYLKKKFAVKTYLEPRNIPPYFIMRAEK